MLMIWLIYHFRENFENKNTKIKRPIFSLSFEEQCKKCLLTHILSNLVIILTVIILSIYCLLYFPFFIFFLIFCFSVSEYAYNMLSFLRNFSLNMLIVVMLIKKKRCSVRQEKDGLLLFLSFLCSVNDFRIFRIPELFTE